LDELLPFSMGSSVSLANSNLAKALFGKDVLEVFTKG
jgi:hypothetical protein